MGGSTSASVPRKPNILNREGVAIDEPLLEQKEAIVYEQVGSTSSHGSVIAENSMYEYHELEEYKNLKGEKKELHTYERVLSLNERANMKTGILLDPEKDTTQRRYLVETFQQVVLGHQYNILDHSIVGNPVHKGVVKVALKQNSMGGGCWGTPQASKQLLMSKTSDELVPQDNMIIYQTLGNQCSPANTSAHPQISVFRQVSPGDDHEYHALEELNAHQNQSIKFSLTAASITTHVTSQEQLLPKCEEIQSCSLMIQ